jgi:predicted amidohydrolase
MDNKMFQKSYLTFLNSRVAGIIFLMTIAMLPIDNSYAKKDSSQPESEKKTLKVAGAKLPVTKDIDLNIAEIKKAIDFAKVNSADILITPEGSLSGYTDICDREKTENGLKEVVEYAKKNHIGLALGTCYIEPEDGKCYNEIRFYDKEGNFLGFHAKILKCRSEFIHYETKPLEIFEFDGIKIGGLICNDLWANPVCTLMPDDHLTRQLAKMGAEIIFHSANGGRDSTFYSDIYRAYHGSNLQLRALGDALWIVTTDNSYPTHLKSAVPSGVVAPDGTWACPTNYTGVQYFVYRIEL